MPGFDGRINELPNILVDNFQRYESHTCFFLSHCHSDHMLDIEKLLSALENKCDSYLYCSPISRVILLEKYKSDYQFVIKELTTSTVIHVPQYDESISYDILVTPIPSGHCAGSVMFLFEALDKTILYTGDVRINKNDIRKFKALHSKKYVKPIDILYFDSTFFNEEYWHFPKRSEVVSTLVTIIKDWLGRSGNHQILLQTSAFIGYEFAIIEIARRLKCRIHVNTLLYNIFSHIPEIGCAVTDDCGSTRIHVCNNNTKKCINQSDTLNVKLSAQWYKSPKDSPPEPLYKVVNKRNIKMCYSNHSSCSELVEFLNHLHPGKVETFTTTVGLSEENKKSYLQEIMSLWPTTTKKRKVEKGFTETVSELYSLEKNYNFKLKVT